MDISADRIGTAFVDLNVTTYIEKLGGDPKGNTSLVLRAYSKESGLLKAQKEIKLGSLKKGDAESVSQTISLPKTGGYKLRSFLYEENVQKSNGEIEIYNLDTLPADVQNVGLEIPEMDFRVKGVEGTKVLVESDIYLANEGRGKSQNFNMLVKAREMDAGFLADKVWIQTGEIKPETTVIRTVSLTIPDQYNYIVEVLIWNNDTIVKRGEGYIKLNPRVEIKNKSTTESRKIQTGEFVNNGVSSGVAGQQIPKSESSGAAGGVPGFILPFSAVLFILAAIFRRRYR
ncbi:MAG TPA: hypothetical protein VN278_06850 [Methanosarcina sp.]|nr:hypothetical protein [Methanosarcina sp.]